MGCKHEGGTESCARYADGHCKVQRKIRVRKKYHNDPVFRAKMVAKSQERRRADTSGSLIVPHKEYNRIGYGCELIVAADLNLRCGLAYLNPVPFTEHDVFVRAADGWRTVQVKKAGVDAKTGHIHLRRGRKHVVSDILALVDLKGRRIRYEASAKPLPLDLPKTPVRACAKLAIFPGRPNAAS